MIPAIIAKNFILKLVSKPRNIIIMILIICCGFLTFKINSQEKKILKMDNQMVNIQNDNTNLLSHNKKCITEKDLLVGDQATMQNIINGLKADLVAEQANSKKMVENIIKKYELINNSVSIDSDNHIKEGKIVDDKSSENIVDYINSINK